MGKFSDFASVFRLKELAKKPLDLTQPGVLNEKRVESFRAEGLGLKLLYATQRLDETTLQTLFEFAEETQAVEQMKAMQAGAIVNVIEGFESEKRSVLHTAMRDVFDSPNAALRAKEASHAATEELKKLGAFLQNEKRFTTLVQIGIGGSDLGPRAIYYGLQAFQNKERRLFFISNVDPDDAAQVLSQVDLNKTLFVVVSKSGTTLETRTNEEFVKERLKKAGLDPKNHLVAVTGQGSPMDDPSKYLRSFYIWDYVGGRYSVTSMVGAVMLGFALGMDHLRAFLKGAHDMDKMACERDPRRNLPLLAALLGIWNRNFLSLPTCAVLPYSQPLFRFTAHLQQLDMESNGKQIDKQGKLIDCETGPIIWGEPGTNGQHSFYQLLHQGTSIVPLEFIGFSENQRGEDLNFQGTTCQEKLLANLLAQTIAFAIGQKNSNPNKNFPGNRPSSLLLAKRLDPYTMGTLLALYEHKVAFQGFIWNINSFDQEGVQLGKVLATKILEEMTARRSGKPSTYPLGEAYLKQLF